MDGEVTAATVEDWLKRLTPAWGSLHTANPNAGSGTALGTEVVGGSYARQSITWTNRDPYTVWLNNVLTFVGLPECRVYYVGIFNAQVNGLLRACVRLSSTGATIRVGGSFKMDKHTIAIGVGSSP